MNPSTWFVNLSCVLLALQLALVPLGVCQFYWRARDVPILRFRQPLPLTLTASCLLISCIYPLRGVVGSERLPVPCVVLTLCTYLVLGWAAAASHTRVLSIYRLHLTQIRLTRHGALAAVKRTSSRASISGTGNEQPAELLDSVELERDATPKSVSFLRFWWISCHLSHGKGS